jgi:adenylate kinase
MVRDRLAQPDAAKGFLLDGFPRTTAQVGALDEMLAERGERLDRVVELVVPDEEVVARLLRRAAQEGRSDDTEAVVQRRQELYREETAPLARVYSERGLLRRVDGTGELDAVTKRVLAALEE